MYIWFLFWFICIFSLLPHCSFFIYMKAYLFFGRFYFFPSFFFLLSYLESLGFKWYGRKFFFFWWILAHSYHKLHYYWILWAIWFCLISKTLVVAVLSLYWDTVGEFSSPANWAIEESVCILIWVLMTFLSLFVSEVLMAILSCVDAQVGCRDGSWS